MGTEVHLVELQDRIVPIEDEDVSKQLARSFKKAGIKVSTGATVERVEEDGKTLKVHLKTSRKKEVIDVDQVLSSVGIMGNIEDLGLEDVGVETDRGFIKTDELSRTKVKGVYAIGDVAGPPWKCQ